MTDIYRDAIERLCKWRTVFVGWQLGTRAKGDPEADAVKDQRELLILLRMEVNAITSLLVKKGLITHEGFTRLCAEEAEHLNLAYETRFPGFKATEIGMVINPEIAVETTKGWKP